MKNLSKIWISLLILLVVGTVGYIYHKYHFSVPKIIPELQLHGLKDQIIAKQLPKHVAIMMDGNGRWATRQGKPRVFGHMNGLQGIEEAIAGCIELGIPYLTLWAFSTENWERSQEEIDFLMQLMKRTIPDKLPELVKNNVKLQVIGDLARLPADCRAEIKKAVKATKENTGLHLTVGISYSGKWDILQAVKAIAKDIETGKVKSNSINPQLFEQYLSTRGLPDPDLVIRPGGEMRVSNFMLWQLAYTEIFPIHKYWPDFRKIDLFQAVIAYQERDRRFGKVAN